MAVASPTAKFLAMVRKEFPVAKRHTPIPIELELLRENSYPSSPNMVLIVGQIYRMFHPSFGSLIVTYYCCQNDYSTYHQTKILVGDTPKRMACYVKLFPKHLPASLSSSNYVLLSYAYAG